MENTTERIIVFTNNQHLDNEQVIFRSYQDLYKVVSLMLQGHRNIYLEFDIKKYPIHKNWSLFDVQKNSVVGEKRFIVFIETYKKPFNVPGLLPSIDYTRDGVGSGIYYYTPDHYDLYKDDVNIHFIRNKKIVKAILKADNVIEEISKYIVTKIVDEKIWFNISDLFRNCLVGVSKIIGLKLMVGL